MSEGMKNFSDPTKPAPLSENTAPSNDRRFFGLKTKSENPLQDVSDDYEQRFPEDPIFEETGSNARVWRTYLAESTAFDENMVGEARDGLDAMLVFAGLFSAVVTSFLVQTSQNLQVDYTEMSASLLSELIAVQRAAANGTAISAVPVSALNFSTAFVPDTLDIWVNGLWVVSLSLSLVVALSAVLVKQWLYRYIAFRSGTPKDRSHTRQSRYIGFEKWQVQGIIGSLPVIMHLSLGIFFLGLVLFLLPLQLVLCCIIGALTFVLYTLYLASNILPVFFQHCPYQTPLSDFIIVFLRRTIPSSRLRKMRREDVASNDSLSVKALHWLYCVSCNPSVDSVIFQAAGGLPATVATDVRRMFNHQAIYSIYRKLMNACITYTSSKTTAGVKPGFERIVERLNRAYLMFDLERASPPEIISYPPDSDPRFHATTLAALATGHSRLGRFWMSRFNADLRSECRLFILAHHDVPHHPLVWKSLVQSAMLYNVFSDYRTNPVVFKLLFPAVWAQPVVPSATTLATMIQAAQSSPHSLVTMVQAVHLYMHEELCEYLLSVCEVGAPRDVPAGLPPRSKAVRLFMMTMELALDRVSCVGSLEHQAEQWEIIGHALSIYNDDSQFFNRYPILEEQHMFFKSFVVRLIRQTDICDSHPEGSEFTLWLRGQILEAYLSICRDLLASSKLLAAGTPEANNNLLRRAIEGSLRDMSHTPAPLHQHNVVAFQILELTIGEGSAAAYQLIGERDCLQLLCQSKCPIIDTSFIGHFINSLVTGLVSNAVEATTREACIDHLFEEQNLRIAVVSSIIDLQSNYAVFGPEKIKAMMSEFAKLRPDESSWAALRQWLILVLEWLEEDKDPQDFCNRGLGEEWTRDDLLMHLDASYGAVNSVIRSLDKMFSKEEADSTYSSWSQPRSFWVSTPPHTSISLERKEPEPQRKLPLVSKVLPWREVKRQPSSGMKKETV